jgi:hypothetical protein
MEAMGWLKELTVAAPPEAAKKAVESSIAFRGGKVANGTVLATGRCVEGRVLGWVWLR